MATGSIDWLPFAAGRVHRMAQGVKNRVWAQGVPFSEKRLTEARAVLNIMESDVESILREIKLAKLELDKLIKEQELHR